MLSENYERMVLICKSERRIGTVEPPAALLLIRCAVIRGASILMYRESVSITEAVIYVPLVMCVSDERIQGLWNSGSPYSEVSRRPFLVLLLKLVYNIWWKLTLDVNKIISTHYTCAHCAGFDGCTRHNTEFRELVFPSPKGC